MTRTAVIRTSDRGQFKSCRRRWSFSSHLHRNLEPLQAQTPLWFGTGIHFAMEDYFNPKSEYPFETPGEAFKAYVLATQLQSQQQMPDDWEEQNVMGMAMLNYLHDVWLKTRDPLETLIYKGIPQLEINFLIDIPFDIKKLYPDSPYDNSIYSGTIDRVTIDKLGRIWLVDYKTAKIMKSSHFANDPQVTAYCWAAQEMYPEYEIAGMIYWQFLKAVPKQPEPLKSGKISTAKNKKTSHALYRQALIDTYGSVDKSSPEHISYLNNLAISEDEDHDAYITRNKIYKNPRSLAAEGAKILLEVADMLNPNISLYPNATFMCPGMCPHYEVCLSVDDGSDWEFQLNAETQERAKSDESWRASLPKAIEQLYPSEETTIDFDNPPGQE